MIAIAETIRQGVNQNGPWHVLVERAGRYQIALRRWPAEADAAVTAALESERRA